MARHRRCLAKHQVILAPAHARILRQLREEQAPAAPDDDVEVRDLSVYDRVLGVA